MPISLTLSAIDAAVAIDTAQRNTPTTPVATPADVETVWQVVVVDLFGVAYGDLENAVVTSMTWNIVTPDEATVDVPIDASGLALLNYTTQREVQIYRNGNLLIWGKVTGRRADSASRVMTLTVKDPRWYFTRRYVGKPNRDNRLINGGFEAGTAPWVAVGTTFTAATDIVLVGTKAAKLVTATAGDNYIHQRRVATSGSIGLNLFLTAWFYLESFVNPAQSNAGIVMQREGATGSFARQVARIDEKSPIGSWTRLSVLVRMPPNVTEVIDSRLYGPEGTIRWDAATVVAEQSLGFPPNTDQATLMTTVIQYAQGKGIYGIYSAEKSDLNVLPDFAVTGVQRERNYQLADHQPIFNGSGSGVLDEFLRADDGLDWGMVYTPTSKILRGYYPTRGTDRTDITFTFRRFPDTPELDSSWGIVGWSYADSIERTADQVCELGGWGGTGGDQFATREEGGFDDPSPLGGLTLELVEPAPQGSPIGTLDHIAQARGAQLENPISTPQLTIAEPRDPTTGEVTYPLIGVLMPGDTIPVDLVDGEVTMQDNWRLAQVVLTRDPNSGGEVLVVTPNPVS